VHAGVGQAQCNSITAPGVTPSSTEAAAKLCSRAAAWQRLGAARADGGPGRALP
jgi:hypothetical protein